MKTTRRHLEHSPHHWTGAILLLATITFLEVGHGAGPRALPDGQRPNDVRLQPLKDLDGYFPFTPSTSAEQWARRAERVRRQILVAEGLWPMPTKTPLNAVIHGRIDRGDHTVEKVYFESVPGFFVTGNLYRPKNKTGRVPGVLSPHGHWSDGRFHDAGRDGVRKEIVQGAERFEEGGRSPLQARCMQLARLGCVVFHYDMIGYADSVQISQALAHGFAKQRPEMNTLENWGLFSPQAEAHLQSVMGLQTWNSIRALDFLLDLPDVDPQRIACTGASGGGTQTFILSAIDPRLKVAFPAVMVSTAMQGGCTCENACLLRLDTGNVEFAALFAPRPLGMTAADDWTKEMPSKGFPELQRHFAMLGAENQVFLKPLLHFGHNYNYVSRAAMYGWLNKHLQLGLEEPILEEDYRRLTREEMSVWDAQHPKPEGGPDFERKLLRWLTDDASAHLQSTLESPEEFRRIVGGVVEVLIGRNWEEVGEVTWTPQQETDRGDHTEVAGLLRNATRGEELPAVFLRPRRSIGRTVLWVDGTGKAGLYSGAAPTTEPGLRDPIRRLLDAGINVVGVDLLLQGEFLGEEGPTNRTRRVKNPREAAAYTFGYNPTLFAQRVHDLLTTARYLKVAQPGSQSLDLVGLRGAGPWVAAARALAREAIDRAVIDTAGFRFGQVLDIHDLNFLPGGAKYFDLPGMLALAAPGRTLVAGEDGPARVGVPDVVSIAYRQAPDRIRRAASGRDPKALAGEAIDWLLAPAAK